MNDFKDFIQSITYPYVWKHKPTPHRNKNERYSEKSSYISFLFAVLKGNILVVSPFGKKIKKIKLQKPNLRPISLPPYTCHKLNTSCQLKLKIKLNSLIKIYNRQSTLVLT